MLQMEQLAPFDAVSFKIARDQIYCTGLENTHTVEI